MEEDYGIDVEAARSAGNKYFEFLDEYEKKEQADGASPHPEDYPSASCRVQRCRLDRARQ